MILIVTLLLFLGMAAGVKESYTKKELRTLSRPENGTQLVRLFANRDGEEQEIEISLSAPEKTEEEKEAFKKSLRKALSLALFAKEAEQGVVTQGLTLPAKLLGAKLYWMSDNWEVLKSDGSLGDARMGGEVKLTAVVYWNNEEFTESFPLTVTPVFDLGQSVRTIIRQSEEENPLEKEIVLPDTLAGEKISFYQKTQYKLKAFAFLFLMVGILLYVKVKEEPGEWYKNRQRQLKAAYPGLVSRLAVNLTAGLSVPMAIERMVSGYEEGLKKGEPMEDSMEELRHLMLSGRHAGYNEKTFASLAARCRESGYLRLSNLLQRSMLMGEKDMAKSLVKEAERAFEEAKRDGQARAKVAGAKLLPATTLLFILVLLEVMVPVFLGF